jgi:hypothetical protein
MNPEYRLPFPSDRLFGHAMRILDDASTRYGRPFDWTFGGGTVMAMRHEHRYSKDVDIFVPDPQYLGYLSPRLSDAAAVGDPDYEEAAEFIKLRYPEGEVDFVVGTPLTDPGWMWATVHGRQARLETDVEIVAKKLHFRGNSFKARDVFDLALLLSVQPQAAAELHPWAQRHRPELLSLTGPNANTLRATFAVIDVRRFRPAFDDAIQKVREFLEAHR